jgi:hypothetical protein
MSFEEFALTEQMINFQTRRLGNKNIESFSHVGTTDNLRSYMDYFDPLRAVNIKRLNESPSTPVCYPHGFECEIRDIYKEDYNLYEAALKLSAEKVF